MSEESRPRIRLLLPLQPEEECDNALRLIGALGPKEAFELLRVYVYRAAELDTFAPENLFALPSVGRLDAREEEVIEELTRRSCRQLADNGYHIEYAFIDAVPFDGIVAAAQQWDADLIVMRKSSLRPPEAHIGHTTRVLVDHSSLPLLTYGDVPADFTIRTIAVAHDLTERSAPAVEWGKAFSRMFGAHLHAVHVAVQHLWRHEDVERAHSRLSEFLGGTAATRHVEQAESMIQGVSAVMDRIGADLLIAAAHHHSAASILGSHDRQIVRDSRVPVLTIPETSEISPAAFAARLGAWRQQVDIVPKRE